MFQTASGVVIPFPEMIKEEFQTFENRILFNLSFENLKSFVNEFIDQLPEPMFFVLEMPMSQQEEAQLRTDDTQSFHKKICYLEGQSKEQISNIFNNYGEILLNDGISQFAVYSHAVKDGFYIQKYKVVSIYSHAPEKYIDFLKNYGLEQTDNLITAWDTFSQESPGQAERVEINEVDIYCVYDELMKMGMYVAKITED